MTKRPMTTKALQTQAEPTSKELAEVEAMLSAFGQDLSPVQVKLSWLYAQKRGLDLLSRQLVPTVMKGRLTFITTIDGFRVVAERSGDYAGQDPIIYGPAQGDHPEWAEATVYRHSWGDRGLTVRAFWREFYPEGKAWAWDKMPHVMLGKVAEAQALRKAFPNDMSGMYSDDEMAQAGDAPVQQPDSNPDGLERGPDSAETETPTAQPVHEVHVEADAGQNVIIEDNVIDQLEVKAREQPDGMRIVKKPEWAEGLQGSTVPKIEIKAKLGRRNITLIVLGETAERLQPQLERVLPGSVLRVDGTQHEYEWQKGKPKALQVRGITHLTVLEHDEWVELTAIAPEPEAVEAEVPKADSSAEPMDATSTPDPSKSSGSDLTAVAAEEYADLLDADVDPGRGGNPNVGDQWEQLPVLEGTSGEAVSLEGYYAKGASTEVPGNPGRFMWDAWVTSLSMDSRYHVLMSEQVAEATGVDRLGPGEQVYVSGTWRRPKDQPVVLAESIRPA